MAQLKSTVVAGNLRVTDEAIANSVQTPIVKAPTTSGGTTYGVGTNGQVIKSNGTTVYWGDDNSGLELGETSTTAYRGDYGKIAYDHATFGQNVFYVEGGSSDTAGVWTGTITGLTAYFNGLTILFRPTDAGGSSATSINLHGLGAVPCYTTGTSALTTHYAVGSVILFTYYDNAWRRADYNSNTTYSAQTAALLEAGANTSNRTIRADVFKAALKAVVTQSEGKVMVYDSAVGVGLNQGSENAGKLLAVGSDGNIELVSLPRANGGEF